MKSARLISCVLIFAASLSGAGAAERPAESLRGAEIILPADAIPAEKYAAEEFGRLLKESAGIEPAAAGAANAKNRIYLGFGEAAAARFPELKIDDLGDEGLRIIAAEDAIAIAGGRPRGTLYGVYEFFEKFFGVRFLTFDHTHYPAEAKSAAIPIGETTVKPIFSFRWSFYKENSDHPDFAARMRVNTVTKDEKLGGATPQNLIGHSYYHFMPVEKYGKEHPEYFALVDGVRKLEGTGGGPEICVTNPQVLRIVAEGVIRDLDANPTLRNITVSQNDNDAYCRCEKCEAVNQAEGTPMGSNLQFVNAVAEIVQKKYPNTKIGTLAYWYTRKAPKTIRPRANVQIQLCSIEACTLHPLEDNKCEKNRAFAQDMAEWKAICNDIWIWNYNTNFGAYDLPFPNLRAIGPNVNWFSRNNVHGVFMQANGNGNAGEMCDLRNYVMSRCLWNPDLNSWELAEEFCRLHYGRSSAAIIDYLTMLHDNAEKRGVHPECFPSAHEVGLTPEIAGRAIQYFEDAKAVAESGAIRERVEKAAICAMKASLETSQVYLHEPGRMRIEYAGGGFGLVERYIAATKKHGLTMSAETRTIESFIADLSRLRESIPSAELETPAWIVTALPGENGKLARLIHKPSGRDLVAAPGRAFHRHHPHEDWGMTGLDHTKPAEFRVIDTPGALTFAKDLESGETHVRTIAPDAGDPEALWFHSTIYNTAADERAYKLWIHPEYDSISERESTAELAVFAKQSDGKWRLFNEGNWHYADGPGAHALSRARGGGFAFFAPGARFGVMQSYEGADFIPRLWWNAGRRQVNLELRTEDFKLAPGASRTFAYKVKPITAPPK